ncbi:MAG: hypothetical protein DCF28_00985 [Alphaproteobacteria bacterium]|nr:MAG: hypothetical protein DCF28_00985 [Alphaproteobacteria bacterium]PZO37589.1 MAG: hypothetical protein DCE92_07295 [Alphaproteobacteria bacterium]
MPGSREYLTEADVARREPLWLALSDLFLDTEIQPETFDWIARTAMDVGFSSAETRTILETEVLPALGFNLLSIAGEWAGFDPTFVRERVLLATQRGALSRAMDHVLLTPVRRAVLRRDWVRLEAAMRARSGQ